MRDTIPLDRARGLPRPHGIGRGVVRARRAAGRALARMNRTATVGSLHASDIAQLRRAMRD